MDRSRVRPGFTLIELLVVIAIIAILIGLLLPAVQKVRETANRIKCRNNLKQIGLGLLAYHNDAGVFPPGYSSTVGNGGFADDRGPGWGWATFLLPYVDQQGLYSSIQFDKDITDPVNAVARQTILPIYLCPSDPGNTTFAVDVRNDPTANYSTPLTDSSGNPVRVARSNYVGIFGSPEITPDPGFLDRSNPARGLARQGMMYRNSKLRIADVTDGTSNTLFVGERSSNLAYATWTGAVTGGQVPAKLPDTYGYGPEGAPVLILGHTGDASDVPPHTPNSSVNHVDDFWSRHMQGANFLFVDGSVRIINDTINPATWWGLGTRSGGEVIPPLD